MYVNICSFFILIYEYSKLNVNICTVYYVYSAVIKSDNLSIIESLVHTTVWSFKIFNNLFYNDKFYNVKNEERFFLYKEPLFNFK